MTDIRKAQPLHAPASDELRYLPEGPISLGDSLVSWVAIQHGLEAKIGSLNLLDLRTNTNQSFQLPGRPGFAIPCEQEHRFVIGCERSLGLFDVASGNWETFCEGIDAGVDNTIINDGIAYEDNLIFGTKDLEFATKKAGIYLYRGSDRQLICLDDKQICSNGKAILHAKDGSLKLLDIDSPTRQICCFDLDIPGGRLGESSVVIDFTGDPAVPDGAIVTPDETGIIVAMFRPEVADWGETRWYDIASGELRCVWQTPGSPQNTCPALVRIDGQMKLLITTAVEHMDEHAQSACGNAGKIFIGDIDLMDNGTELTHRFQIS